MSQYDRSRQDGVRLPLPEMERYAEPGGENIPRQRPPTADPDSVGGMGTPWRPPFDSKTVIGPGRVDMKLNNSRHRRPYNVADSTVSVPFADWIRFEEWLATQQPEPSLTEAEQARAAHSIETVSGPISPETACDHCFIPLRRLDENTCYADGSEALMEYQVLLCQHCLRQVRVLTHVSVLQPISRPASDLDVMGTA
jgi:hypothetical protein